MECHFDVKKGSTDRQAPCASGTTPTALRKTIEKINSRVEFRIDRRDVSYADMHPEITKTIHPKFMEHHPKQWIGKKVGRQADHLKYVSKFPGGLHKNGGQQEKLMTVGVLESQHLEKCHHSPREVPTKKAWPYATRTKNFSSNPTNDSSDPRRSNAFPSECEEMPQHSLQYHLMSSYSEGKPKAMNSFGQNIQSMQVSQGVQPDAVDKDQSPKDRLPDLSPPRSLGKVKRDLDLKIEQRMKTFQSEANSLAGSCTLEVKPQPQPDELLKRKIPFDSRRLNYQEKIYPFPLRRHLSKKNLTDAPKFQGSSMSPSDLALHHPAQHGSHLNDSYPSSTEVGCNKHPPTKLGSLIDRERNNLSLRSSSAPRSTKVGTSPSRSRYFEDKFPNIVSKKIHGSETRKIQDSKSVKGAVEKSRSISPFRRLSFSIGKTSKSSSSKDGFALTQSTATKLSAKYNIESAAALTSTTSVSSDKPCASNRARSSPLRRLLEPLMRPKAASNACSLESSHNKVASKFSDRRACLSNTSKAESNATRDAVEGKQNCHLLTTQALLRVTVKNDQLMFTLALEKETEICAATLKKLNTKEEGDVGYMYTFFSIQEAKRKNMGWINQGVKGEAKDYISNLVAQMRIYGSQPSDQCTIREFVLFSVSHGIADQQLSDPEPRDELAAICIKVPRRVDEAKNISQAEKQCDSKDTFFEDVGATVILPSGIHSLPHKGGPSSLMQRWKSGGSCDCGGWDMGCNLRILTNEHHVRKAYPNSSFLPTNFELFFQGGPQDSEPFLRLASFRDKIYSVEYNPSLSLLQAFSICIAIWDSQKLCERSGSCFLNPGETILFQNDGMARPNSSEGEARAKYISYPPVSPVGRV